MWGIGGWWEKGVRKGVRWGHWEHSKQCSQKICVLEERKSKSKREETRKRKEREKSKEGGKGDNEDKRED